MRVRRFSKRLSEAVLLAKNLLKLDGTVSVKIKREDSQWVVHCDNSRFRGRVSINLNGVYMDSGLFYYRSTWTGKEYVPTWSETITFN